MRVIDYPRPARALVDSDVVPGWVDGQQVQLPVAALSEHAQAGVIAAVQPSIDAAAASAAAASLDAATALTATNLYPTAAAGAAAVVEGGYFTVVGDGTSTYAILYRRVGGVAVEQARYVSKAAYEGPGGANLIGFGVGTVGGKLARIVYVTDFPGGLPGLGDNTAAINAAIARAAANGGGTVFFPGSGAVKYQSTGYHALPSGVKFDGDGDLSQVNLTADAPLVVLAFDAQNVNRGSAVENIAITSDDFSANPVSDAGVIEATGGHIRGFKVRGVSCNVPKLGRNCIRIKVAAGTTLKGAQVADNILLGSGRMLVEVVQHDQGDVGTCQDVRITGNTLAGAGQMDPQYAMLCSVSGNMQGIWIDGQQYLGTSQYTIGQELVGELQGLRLTNSNWSGQFGRLIQNTANPGGGKLRGFVFSALTTDPGRAPTYSAFPTVSGVGPALTTGEVYLANATDGVITACNFDLGLLSTPLTMTSGVSDVEVVANRFATQHTNVASINGRGIRVENNRFSLTGAAGTAVGLGKDSANCFVTDNTITTTNGPSFYVSDGGTGNTVVPNRCDGTSQPAAGVNPQAKFYLGPSQKVKVTLGDTLSPINPDEPGFWTMFALHVEILALDQSGGNPARTSQILYFKWLSSRDPVAWLDTIDQGTSGLTLSASSADNVITLQASGMSGGQVVGWVITVSSGLASQYFTIAGAA